jgi:hypothetical protein
MFETIFTFALAWVFPFAALALIIAAFVYNDSRQFGKSTFTMLLSAGLAGTYFWSDISPFLAAHGLVSTVLYLAGLYIAAAFITSFVYWIFYIWKAKERFDYLMTTVSTPGWALGTNDEYKLALRKYMVLGPDSNRRAIFDDRDDSLRIHITSLETDGRTDVAKPRTPATQAELTAAVAEVLPPRFTACKSFVVGAGCSWPITIIWLLVSRVVKQSIERLVSMFGGTFDKISVLAFGKF